MLVLFTDGVTEAMSVEGQEFGEEGLRKELAVQVEHSPREIVEHLSDHLKAFIGDQEQMDDITLIAIKKDQYSRPS